MTCGFLPANAIASFLFVLIHWPGWLYMGGWRAELATLTVSVFVIGWLLGLLLERSGSLWPCILLHTANNLLFSG